MTIMELHENCIPQGMNTMSVYQNVLVLHKHDAKCVAAPQVVRCANEQHSYKALASN